MSAQPPIPDSQRADHGASQPTRPAHADRRDLKTGLQSSDAGDADTNLDEQGRQANMRQNLKQTKRP